MIAYCLIAIVLQGLATVVDEGWFHRTRGLSRRERLGHPLDTLTLVVCLAWLLSTTPGSRMALPVYIGLAIFSTLFITRDARLHARVCSSGEQWLHAALFALHPIVLAAFAYLWWTGALGLLVGQLGVTIAFMAYQVIYWNVESPIDSMDDSPVSPIARLVEGLPVVVAPRAALATGEVCDGSRDGQVLVDEVRARAVRDRGSRTGQDRALDGRP